MRTSRQIKKTLKEIEKLWLKHKDQRLCQLFTNAAMTEGRSSDLFFLEDGDIVDYLKRYDAGAELIEERPRRRHTPITPKIMKRVSELVKKLERINGSSKVVKRKVTARKGKKTRKKTR